jgi:hypothetical protein
LIWIFAPFRAHFQFAIMSFVGRLRGAFALFFTCLGMAACGAISGIDQFGIDNSPVSVDGSVAQNGDSGGKLPPTTDAQVTPGTDGSTGDDDTDGSTKADATDGNFPDSGPILPYPPTCSRSACNGAGGSSCTEIDCGAGGDNTTPGNWTKSGNVGKKGATDCSLTDNGTPAFVSTFYDLAATGSIEFELTFVFQGGAASGTLIAQVGSSNAVAQLKIDGNKLQLCNQNGACTAETPAQQNLVNDLPLRIDVYGTMDPSTGGTAWFTTEEATSCAPYGSVPLGKSLNKITAEVGCVTGTGCGGDLHGGEFSVRTF